MINFIDRPEYEKIAVRKAYEFEVNGIKAGSWERNPYYEIIRAFPDGKELWEAINVALEIQYA